MNTAGQPQEHQPIVCAECGTAGHASNVCDERRKRTRHLVAV